MDLIVSLLKSLLTLLMMYLPSMTAAGHLILFIKFLNVRELKMGDVKFNYSETNFLKVLLMSLFLAYVLATFGAMAA